jgi:regulator of G-protein signaling
VNRIISLLVKIVFYFFYLAEALHLASLLCYYGYFFHVTTNGAVQIKEDNELFRFQAPYFWVSTNWTTGNIEYGLLKKKVFFLIFNFICLAIYLIKRTLRNRQRHGLEEHEMVCLLFMIR